jgi:glycosyltransferase involved in cell wall biosynthesis
MSKVSIIVPVHNTEKYLENTVRSLLAQTLKDIEVILVENASTDGSLALCHELAKTDDRIKVMHLEKGDLSHARNNGLTLATSEYVAFVDSDDTVKPEMYETLLGIAEEHNLDLVYSNIMKVYDNRPPKYIYTEDEKVLVMSPKEMLIKNFTHKINVNACTMIARKCLFDNLKFPEDMYFEDRAFTFRLINATSKVGYINKAFYHYYQRSGSIVHLKNWKMYYDFAESDRMRLEFIRDSKLFTDEEKLLVSRKSSESLLRKLRHLHAKAKTKEQKQQFREVAKNIALIPEGCPLPLKARIIRRVIKIFYL